MASSSAVIRRSTSASTESVPRAARNAATASAVVLPTATAAEVISDFGWAWSHPSGETTTWPKHRVRHVSVGHDGGDVVEVPPESLPDPDSQGFAELGIGGVAVGKGRQGLRSVSGSLTVDDCLDRVDVEHEELALEERGQRILRAAAIPAEHVVGDVAPTARRRDVQFVVQPEHAMTVGVERSECRIVMPECGERSIDVREVRVPHLLGRAENSGDRRVVERGDPADPDERRTRR